MRRLGVASFFSVGQANSSAGSTRSHELYFPTNSSPMMWPHTDVILKRTVSPRNWPVHSCTEQALFEPLRDEHFPLLRMPASEAASDGFSATISATLIVELLSGTSG
uniref:Putative secreted protein n=1 Tax=Anopheles triannulatus TaxID=58253 RepID=A0A2M4B6T5_9DIPT